MNDEQKEKTVSPEQLAANRQNATRSTGPRTADGKQRASQNSYKHGFFCDRLFPTKELLVQDAEQYNRIFHGYRSHYLPVGFLEDLLVEKIATESLRIARLFGHEQNALKYGSPFELKSMDRILRYESTVSRQLEKAMDQLERLQEQRKAQTHEFEPADLESDEAISKTTDEATAEGPESSENLTSGGHPEVSDSSVAPEAPVTAAQNEEAGAPKGLAPTNGHPSNKPAETGASTPPTSENCATNPGAQTLTKLLDQFMAPVAAEESKSSLRPDEHYGTDSSDTPRFIETAEDEERIESLERGDYDPPFE